MIFERSPIITDYPNIGSNVEKARYYRKNLDEALELGLEEFKSEAIKKGDLLFHPNVNLYIDVIKKCVFNCGFCIAQTTDGRGGEITIDDVFKVLNYLDSLGIEYGIQVTGGEPSLHKYIDEIIYILPPSRKLVINTNFPSRIMLNTFNHINVSCHHYNSKTEADIMNGSRDRDELKEMIYGNQRVRLNCNLIGGYIDTFGEVMQYIAWAYHYMGVRNISFSSLTALPENTMYEQGIINYVKNRPSINYANLLECVENAGHWEFKKFRGGVACYYEIWQYNAYEYPVMVQFKYSDNHYLDLIDKQPDLIPDLILHPNGVLTGSWDQRIKAINF